MNVSGTLQQLLSLADNQSQKTMNFDNINSHPQQQHNYVIVSEENKEEKTEVGSFRNKNMFYNLRNINLHKHVFTSCNKFL